jgi:hypothetical protein
MSTPLRRNSDRSIIAVLAAGLPVCNIDSPSSLCCVGRAVEDGSSGLKSSKKISAKASQLQINVMLLDSSTRSRPSSMSFRFKADRQSNGFIARGLLAHRAGKRVPHPRHWDTLEALN